MKHDHITPLPLALEDLREWFLKDAAFKGKLKPAAAIKVIDTVILPRVHDDNQMAGLLAGYTAQCRGCIADRGISL